MSVRKYRSVEEMPPIARLEPRDPNNLRIACELSELAYGLRPWSFQPGVRKFRSIEAAAEWRAEWERLQVRRGEVTEALEPAAKDLLRRRSELYRRLAK